MIMKHYNKTRSSLHSALLGLALCLFPVLSQAQLAEPNDKGIYMGHLHYLTDDVAAMNDFWERFGAEKINNNGLEMYSIPGTYILIREGEPSAVSTETILNHVGFNVPNADEFYARMQAAGVDIERGGFAAQLWVTTPDGGRIEILADETLDMPLKFHHIHWYILNIPAMQAWYSDMFDAVPGMRGSFTAGDIPGANLTYQDGQGTFGPTQGSVLDHIGFGVTDIEATMARLEAAGITVEGYRTLPNGVSIAFFTDPWGTYVELTEGI
jgi:catechol 2,3-dioxygenase-like lactoylglutathione lyase family enzyme